MNTPTPRSRLRRLLLAALASLAVLVTTFSVVTSADVVPADARPNPVAARVALNGVTVDATNHVDSTVTLCPQAAVVSLRLFNPTAHRSLGHRRVTLYWSTGQKRWHSRRITSRRGPVAATIGGRVAWVQIAAEGYNHRFYVRYRTCATSVGRVSVSTPYGVHGDRRPHIRVSGILYAQRADGTRVRFAHGSVAIHNDRTRRRLAIFPTNASGRFSGVVRMGAPARLTVTPTHGPAGAHRPVAYGESWVRRPRTAVVNIPRWMRGRHVHYTPSKRFAADIRRYAGGFADPTVMRVGRTYYAASTTGSNLNLPLMTSRNLVSWRPRPALRRYDAYSSWPGFNDAMPKAPRWATGFSTRENVKRISQWAPSLARMGRHRFIAAFSAATRATDGTNRHSCIGLAVSRTPAGPYYPFRRPLVCDPTTPLGVIDPDLFVDPRTHRRFLIWAAEGVPHHRKGQLAIRQLNRTGTGWAWHSRRHNLATFTQRWEGVIMENPSMIRFRGTLYLFYSANRYATSRYATGYAICRSALGPCSKPRHRPLLATRGTIAGPGGADAFVDRHRHLRLAYAAWRRGHAGQSSPGRTLHVAALERARNGLLSVHRMTR